MVMIKDSKGDERFSMSQELYDICHRFKEKMLKDDSMVLGIFWGSPGCGKSIAAQHWGYVVDSTLEGKDERVCFDKDEFIKAIIANKQKVVVGDEGISLFFRRNSMTKEGRLMSELMDQIRQKNLCVFICVPKLLTIDSTVLELANFVAYVWETRETSAKGTRTIKGNVAFYPQTKGVPYKTIIVEYLKKKARSPLKKMVRPKPLHFEPGNPVGKVWYPAGKEKYLEKKDSILKKYEEGEKKIKEKRIHRLDWEVIDPMIREGVKQAEIARKMNCTRSMINIRAKKLKKLSKMGDFPRKMGFGGVKLA